MDRCLWCLIRQASSWQPFAERFRCKTINADNSLVGFLLLEFDFKGGFIGEYVLVFYEFGAKEALTGFRHLINISLPDKAAKLYSTALYLLCLKKCDDTKAYNDNLSLLDEYSDLKQKEFYQSVLNGEHKKALALYNTYSDFEKGLFGVMNPFIDAIFDGKSS